MAYDDQYFGWERLIFEDIFYVKDIYQRSKGSSHSKQLEYCLLATSDYFIAILTSHIYNRAWYKNAHQVEGMFISFTT